MISGHDTTAIYRRMENRSAVAILCAEGRDLFDLYWALTRPDLDLDSDKVIHCYKKYMEFSVDKLPTQKQFIVNMEEKMNDKEFLSDIYIILNPNIVYDSRLAWDSVRKALVEKIK